MSTHATDAPGLRGWLARLLRRSAVARAPDEPVAFDPAVPVDPAVADGPSAAVDRAVAVDPTGVFDPTGVVGQAVAGGRAVASGRTSAVDPTGVADQAVAGSRAPAIDPTVAGGRTSAAARNFALATALPVDQGPAAGQTSASEGAAVGRRVPARAGGRNTVRTATARRWVPFPGSFRARLVLAFMAVVAIALALVLATLPPLLDGYFSRQETQTLATRTRLMQELVKVWLIQQLDLDGQSPRPILLKTDPPTPSPFLLSALGTPQQGRTRDFATLVAQANVEVVVSVSPEKPDQVAFRLAIPLGKRGSQPEDRVDMTQTFTLQDSYWTSGSVAPTRLVTVRVSDLSVRVQTIQTIIGVMLAAAALALVVAVFASILISARLTDPIRRLTRATRRLGQGELDARVSLPEGGSPEVGELASAFNGMADRLQETVEFIRHDRDRSRDFLADVSHELRTPIAALRTFNELLAEGAVSEETTRAEFLEQSRQQIERLDWLATNLLELSKLDSGLIALDLRPDDLRGAVESAVNQAEPTAHRKRIQLTMDIPAEPVRQRHDPPRIGQVLNNLIGNAIKFTASGGRVEVRLRQTSEGAELHVSDSGVGIEAEELPRVFERFYRGAKVQESRAAGSGLGLSIVQSIVEMHGGRVTIESTPGRGTDVTVELPRDRTVSASSPAAPPT